VGDVSGHGISSGLITVLARSIFYRGLRDLSSYSLGRIVEEINGELSKELSAVENYLTASVLRFDGSTVEYVNAANTDLAFRRVGKARANFVKPTVEGFKGPPLGREGMEVPYQSVKFTVDKGDSLLIYTDCLSAAVNEEGVPFGSEGLLSAYGMAPADSAADMLAYILEEWKFHVGSAPTSDDLTALLIKKK
jgi:sigma-B regulation protein RsbU (phosphoserine phosphatase)